MSENVKHMPFCCDLGACSCAAKQAEVEQATEEWEASCS